MWANEIRIRAKKRNLNTKANDRKGLFCHLVPSLHTLGIALFANVLAKNKISTCQWLTFLLRGLCIIQLLPLVI